jgi:hypothetical protein
MLLYYTALRHFFVHKRDIIDSLPSIIIMAETPVTSLNENCCGTNEKKIKHPLVKVKRTAKTNENIISKPNELIIEVPKQTRVPDVVSNEKLPLFYEIISNAWPLSNERVENLMITNKRCQFSNESISIKPITAGTSISSL